MRKKTPTATIPMATMTSIRVSPDWLFLLVATVLQELIRRAATIGLGGFFLTEEAIRRAFSDVVPQDWVQFVARQSQATRAELIERMAVEFGSWLREMDPRTLASAVLENFSFSIRIEVSAQPKKEPAGEQRAPDRPRVE